MERTDVLVIGGGPVGLFAALSLLDQGLTVRIIDGGGRRLVRSYACCLHPQTLELFERLGIAQSVLEGAHRVDRLVLRSAEGAVAAELAGLRPGFPHVMCLRQSDLADALEDALEARGVEVSRPWQMTELVQHDGFVRVTARRPPCSSRPSQDPSGPGQDSSELVVDASFVIGADGHDSACRRALGVEMPAARPPRAFAVYEFAADLGAQHQHAASLVLGEEGAAAFWPLGAGVGRWTFEISRRLDQRPTLATLRLLLRRRMPWFTPHPDELCWVEIAEFEHRVARRFGEGRVWLAGDAAHATSPIGFQSMNRGFVEASALAGLIAGALGDSTQSPGAFQRFEREQQAEWVELLGTRTTSPRAARLAPCIPASGTEHATLMDLLSGAGR